MKTIRRRAEKALAYAGLLPSSVAFAAQLAWALVHAGMKRKKAAGHFKKGLLSSGLTAREADRITRACFDG